MRVWRDMVNLARDRAPFGVLAGGKPRHFRAMAQALAENAGQWHKMWQVLNGPCNGCAVQTDGLRDNVLPDSPHFCLVRLGLIEEVLRPAAAPDAFSDVERIARLGNDRIERIGRLTRPLLWRRGERGYRPIDFDEAYALAGEWIAEHRGDRCGFFATSKGVNNEEYYAFQQFARVVGGTHNVDSCARQCHAASVTALKSTIGIGASTGSLCDFMNTDVLVLAGTNLANNQPLVVRYIEHGRRTRGGKPYVIVVNPYREPGLDRYWVPSSPRSALFGSRICDEFVQVAPGGDVAFFNAVLKVIVETDLLTDAHRRFIEEHTAGFDQLVAALRSQSLAGLSRAAGVETQSVRRVAMLLARSENAMFCWGMGLTQHRNGTQNVQSVVNLALALGQLGKPNAGLAALRGQSGVQATGECGVAPNVFPGGSEITAESTDAFAKRWGAPVPPTAGMATGRMVEAAHRGEIDLLFALGGNLRETMPDRGFVEDAIRSVPHRIRLDVMMNREALIRPREASLVLPVRNWYEWDSVFTTTATDRTIRAFRGHLRPPDDRLLESWQALRAIARRVLGDELAGFGYADTQSIRTAMDRDIGYYRGIDTLDAAHKQMQWGGAYLFADGFDAMPDRRAVFTVLQPPARPQHVDRGGADCFWLSTRRGFGQWNSQHRPDVHRDAFTGASTRRAVLMHPEDIRSLGLEPGARLTLISDGDPQGAEPTRRTTAVCHPDPRTQRGHVQAFWPVANDLIAPCVYDDPSGEPDYNVIVHIQPA